MSSDFNVNHISYRFYCDKLASLDQSNNLIIESSANNIEFKANNQNISFNNKSVLNYGLTLNDRDLSNIINITGSILNVDTLFLRNIENSRANIIDSSSINYGYIRATTIGYNPTIIGRSNAYFTYIDVSGGDSSFNDSVYIKNSLDVSGPTTISNDLIVNGTSYVTLYNAISSYISNIKEELSSNKILTLDLSATNISISNELVVNKTSFLNNINIYGQLLNSVLKVPNNFTIDPSGHDNASGTLIINGDLIIYGNRTTIASNIVEISDITLSVATNIINANDLYRNEAGLDISNVASIKYDGTNWNFIGGQITVENKKVSLDVSLIALKTSTDTSLNSLNNYFDLSYRQLINNNDNSYNATYTRSQIDNSFILYSNFDISYNSFRTYLDNSYVNPLTFDASFSSLKTYLDASYILKSTSTIINSIDLSLNFLRDKLDLSYVLKSTFESSYNSLKEQIDISFGSIRLTSLDTSSISVETINTKHSSQRFNNILWNQIGLDISNGPPLINNNKKVAISNDGKVVALSSSSHSDVSKGRVYVYELSYNQASYNWRQLGLSSEILVGVSNDDQFGWDIALSSNGRVVAASSINSDASGINCGQVRLFELSNNNVWRQKGLNINGPRAASESGYSISLAGNGNSIAIGAWKDNSNGTNAGAVRVYDFSANVNDWRQKGQTIAGVSGSFEGYATALSLDGQTLASASIIPGLLSISGGRVSDRNGYIIHSFTRVGSFTFIPSFSGSVEVLIVGGGGGGGPVLGGGGGGGGVIYIPSVSVTTGTSYPIFVGDGGGSGTKGQNSTAFTAIAAGGGTSGSFPDGLGTSGGSGGGAASNNSFRYQGGDTSGNSLGTNSGFIYGSSGGGMIATPTTGARAAGGGGAGGPGSDTDLNIQGDTGQIGMGSGGVGVVNSILGPNYYWAGGGGGGAYGGQTGGWGGLGGGGGGSGNGGAGTGGGSALNSGTNGGAPSNTNGGAGGPNTGGGGGGGAWSNGQGGKGGSGIVIIRYLASNITRGLVKTFTISGTTWTPKGTINGSDISFGRAIKLSATGNAIVIGAPGYTNNIIINRNYTLSTGSAPFNTHIEIAEGVSNRTLASITSNAEHDAVRAVVGSMFAVWIGGRRNPLSTNPLGKSELDWEWINGDTWSIDKFVSGSPNNINSKGLRMYGSAQSGGWSDLGIEDALLAVYMTTSRATNIGQAYVYSYVGGTTWTQLGQTIQGISGGDEFGSSVSMSNDGTIIAVGSDNNSSNRGQVRIFAYANNYWTQISNAIDGKTASSRAGIHALSGDGTTLIQSNNTYNSVYGINKTLAVNAPITTISGNLLVLGNISVNSLDISTNHSYATNGYSYKMFGSDLNTAIMKEYYSDVISTRHLKVQITGNGYITNRNNSYRAISDSRLKENIQDSGPKLEDLLKVRVVDYTMKGSNNTKYIGVLAQELEDVFPNLVTELEPSPKDIQDGNTIKYKAVNYSSFDAILIKSLQEQNAMLKNIEKRIIALEEELDDN